MTTIAGNAMLKAHGKVSSLTAVTTSPLAGGRVLLNFINDRGNPLAGGLILKRKDLYAITEAVRKERLPPTRNAKTIRFKKPQND